MDIVDPFGNSFSPLLGNVTSPRAGDTRAYLYSYAAYHKVYTPWLQRFSSIPPEHVYESPPKTAQFNTPTLPEVRKGAWMLHLDGLLMMVIAT